MPCASLQQVGIDLQDFIAALKEAGAAGIRAQLPPGHVHSFKDLMMPALVRVGAVTERTRALFAEEGIRVFEDASVLESGSGRSRDSAEPSDIL